MILKIKKIPLILDFYPLTNITKKISLLIYMDFDKKYLKYKSKYLKLKNFRNNINQSGGASNEKKEIYLFKAEWCPHCVSFKKTWQSLQDKLKDKYTFVTFDSDKDKASIEKWKIGGFPTIIKRVGNTMKEYVGPRDEESVKTFIESAN
jgi:thiol-disulfide isomerase/thioredoxin